MAILCISVLVTSNLFAHTSDIVKKTCPVCLHEFEAEMDMSGYQSGVRLDLKPLGAIAAPSRVAVCPQCHFVLYTDQLSDEDRDNLREFLASPEYAGLVKEKHSSYFLLARIRKHMNANHFTVAYAYLQASWQVEDELARQITYLNACLDELKEYVQEKVEDENDFRTAQLLIGEILRRTSKFDDATEHFKELSALSEFKMQPYRTSCEYEIKLIQNRDASPKKMPPVEMTEEDIRQTPAFKMLEKSPKLSSFTDLFTVSDLRAEKDCSTYGVYFFGREEWSGDFTPKTKLSCPAMAELIFPIDSNDVISVGLTPTEVLTALTEVCDAPFVQELIKGRDLGKVRLRAAGDRLHWDTGEVAKYIAILKASGIQPPPMRNWMELILDLSRSEMIGLYHPLGEDLYVMDFQLFNNPKWQLQYQEITGERLDTYTSFPDDKYCPIVDRKGNLRLIKKDDSNKVIPPTK